jgi:hypothetical protein
MFKPSLSVNLIITELREQIKQRFIVKITYIPKVNKSTFMLGNSQKKQAPRQMGQCGAVVER